LMPNPYLAGLWKPSTSPLPLQICESPARHCPKLSWRFANTLLLSGFANPANDVTGAFLHFAQHPLINWIAHRQSVAGSLCNAFIGGACVFRGHRWRRERAGGFEAGMVEIVITHASPVVLGHLRLSFEYVTSDEDRARHDHVVTEQE